MKEKRLYTAKDSDMYGVVMGSMQFFKDHLAEFTAYDPSLDITFYNNWKAALDELIPLLPNKDKEEAVSEDSFLIADADKVLAKCREKYKDVKYYASKAFPANKAALKEFGEGTYSKVGFSRLRMVQFMDTLHGVATKYKTELIAQSYTQAAIDHIATLAQELRADNNEQQLKKKERPTETRKRIQALNKFYGFGQRAAAAANRVFSNNEAYRNRFLLAARHHPPVTKHWIVFTAGTVRKIALLKLLKKFSVTLTNQSKEEISYWHANHIHESPAQKFTLSAGEIITVEAETPAKKFLLLQNNSNKAVRVMLVKTKKAK